MLYIEALNQATEIASGGTNMYLFVPDASFPFEWDYTYGTWLPRNQQVIKITADGAIGMITTTDLNQDPAWLAERPVTFATPDMPISTATDAHGTPLDDILIEDIDVDDEEPSELSREEVARRITDTFARLRSERK